MAAYRRRKGTKGAVLPSPFDGMVEEVAARLHATWVERRRGEGWTWGPQRSDAKKTHPDLVPFKKLAVGEQDLNRIVAEEALRMALSLGAVVGDPVASAPSRGAPLNAEGIAIPTLLKNWRTLAQKGERLSPAMYEAIGQAALKKGAPLIAYDIFTEALAHTPGVPRLVTLLGLSLAETGAYEKAVATLTQLHASGRADSDAIGILARAYKDMAWLSGDRRHMEKAHLLYTEGYRMALRKKSAGWRDRAVYTGVNAAATACFAGKERIARTLAKEVLALCASGGNSYWDLASMAEAAAILGRWDEALSGYRQAGELGRDNLRQLTSTRRQARRLLKRMGMATDRFDHCFNVPNVVTFSGHMIDRAERLQPRFPAELEGRVRTEIARHLKALKGGVGFSSAASGADILFIEEMIKRKRGASDPDNVEINIVLPCALDAFREISVDPAGRHWNARLTRSLSHVSTLLEVSPLQHFASPLDFGFTNMTLIGLSQLRAKSLDTDVAPLVVWDGATGDGGGGTATMVANWRARGLEPTIIDIGKLRRDEPIIITRPTLRSPVKAQRIASLSRIDKDGRLVCAMLFCDVVGYSQLNEERIDPFVTHFMGTVAALAKRYRKGLLTRNTWGDAIHMTFASVEQAGLFALDLCETIGGADWGAVGLPADLNLRFGLHAGPVKRRFDPVLGMSVYTGVHVSRAARIEQITPPGHVYASQEYAALVVSTGVTSLAVEYAGKINLPKKYGDYPLYILRRAG
ncbi:MAG: hypothetical protein HQK87_01525 [Nitrospinae bacterium]|nr:hypothetical protein [Nitrospinota bacterium]